MNLTNFRPLFALGFAAVLAACTSDAESAIEDAPPEVAAAERRDLDIRVEASGTVGPIRVVEVKSRASGEVVRLHVETGSRVERGALLAEIDPRDVRNALAQAEADLAVARERLETSRAQKQRAEELRQANVVTEQEYETAALDEANALAQFVKARTNLELARERMGDVTIRAPIDGTIIEKSVEIGTIIASASQNISGGTTLMRMADLAQMQVRTLIDETDIGRVAPGQPARVSVEAYPGRVFVGEVMKIEPQAIAEQNVTMFPVLVRLDNEEGLLRPGMNAEVELEIATRRDVITVPNNAIVAMRDVAAAAATLGLDEEAVRASIRPPRPQPDSARPAAPAGEQRARGARRPEGGRPGGAQGAFGAPVGARRAVVFIAAPEGPQPRAVLIGLNDWDYTEVVSGLEPGENVVLMSVARMQAQQEQFEQRMRERAGGMFGGGR